jgi:hypothetical protein
VRNEEFHDFQEAEAEEIKFDHLKKQGVEKLNEEIKA